MLTLALAVALTAPQPPAHRWIYLQTNFYRPEKVREAEKLVDRAAAAGYNGIVFTDTKIESLWPYNEMYDGRIKPFLKYAEEKNIEIIPVVLSMGYANAMLAHDPSLIESMPCKNVKFRVQDGKLNVVQNPESTFLNGDFETAVNNKFSGLAFQDDPGVATFADSKIKHSGSQSLRIEDPKNSPNSSHNVRICEEISVEPWHQYRYSCWIKTEALERTGNVNVMVLDEAGKSLSWTGAGVQPTQDWTKVNVVFNSQASHKAKFYAGIWDGTSGKMWMDDARLEDVGFLNVTRRAGCPLLLKKLDGSPAVDVDPIEDPKFGSTPYAGEYDFAHEPPAIASKLPDGTVLSADYYAATSTDIGKVAICPSEPKSRSLISGEIKAVIDLFKPKHLFFAHDEIRVMNWCKACQDRHLTSGEILAEDVRLSAAEAKRLSPKTELVIWSDMFDPSHNAVDDYYLCQGSMKNSWKGLPRGIEIMNWNSGKPQVSLDFFAKLGFKQSLAGFYDATVPGITPWITQAKATSSYNGVMYTTWTDDYSKLEAFAKTAW